MQFLYYPIKMLFDDTYKTIKSSSEGLFKDRGSKFLGFAYPITNEDQVKEIIHQLKKEHSQANHHCYAFRLTLDPTVYRASDDREPNGSAGKPILGVIQSAGITDVLIVVVRYFGGSLLGVPGLINAYKSAAQEALKSAKIIELIIAEKFEILFPYDKINDVHSLLKSLSAKIITQDYNDPCKIIFEIRKNKVNETLVKFKTHPTLAAFAKWNAL